MQNQTRRKSETKRTLALFALPLLILGAVPAIGFFKEQVKQRRTQALLRYAPISWCGDGSSGYCRDCPGAYTRPCYKVEIKWLIENGADVNIRNARGVPLIQLCAENDRWATTQMLQRAGARLDRKTQRLFQLKRARDLAQMLDQAIHGADLAWVKGLVTEGADVNFDYASRPGYEQMERGTPLGMAIYAGNVAGAKYLISQGAKLRVNRMGTRVISLALRYRDHPFMLRMLKQAGAPTTPTIEMFIAIIEDRPRNVEKYLRAGIAIDTTDIGLPEKRTPLMQAASHGNARMVRLLLQRGANPKARDANGLTAMDYANGGQEFQGEFKRSDFPQTIALLKRATRS